MRSGGEQRVAPQGEDGRQQGEDDGKRKSRVRFRRPNRAEGGVTNDTILTGPLAMGGGGERVEARKGLT